MCLTMWFEAEYQSFRGQYHTNEKCLPPSSAFLGKNTLWQIEFIHHIRSNLNVSLMNGQKTSQFSRSSAIFRIKKMQPFQTVGPHTQHP